MSTILVIDDSEYVLEATCYMLSKDQHQTIAANSGKEGIKKYLENKDNIDLVLLDFKMPDLSGFQVFYELKKINPEIKVIIISGFCDSHELEILINQGCKFIPKPFSFKEISLAVASFTYDFCQA